MDHLSAALKGMVGTLITAHIYGAEHPGSKVHFLS